MITMEHVNKTYSGGVRAAADLCLTVPSGEIFGFLGPNGAGKTTAIKMITGILQPDSGVIKANGIDIAKNPLEARNRSDLCLTTPICFCGSKGLNT